MSPTIRRSDQTVLSLLLTLAQQDPSIRWVILSGSRSNPSIIPDPLQDFDITYGVQTLAPYLNNLSWIQSFGELMILQMPDQMFGQTAPPGKITYLMQFRDGHRIDLTLIEINPTRSYQPDRLSRVLLDKDQLFADLPAPSDQDYWPQAPTATLFADTCNEFWWVNPYVAKGLWRNELIYAKQMMESVLRTQILTMLIWEVGSQKGFAFNPGYQGKFLKEHLTDARWQALLKTYATADIEASWQALFACCELFSQSAHNVAAKFEFNYPSQEAMEVRQFLDYLHQHQNRELFQ